MLCLLALLTLDSFALAQLATGQKARSAARLEKINRTIAQLNRSQQRASKQQEQLQVALRLVEKEISRLNQALTLNDLAINKQQHKINAEQTKQNKLNQVLEKQLSLLSKHIEARYQFGKHQYLKLLLNQQDPNLVSRLSEYVSYINQARSELIHTVIKNKNEITEHKKQLAAKLLELETLKSNREQSALILKKQHQNQYQLSLAINKKIQDSAQKLRYAKKNKQQLEALLSKLEKQSYPTPSKAIYRMQHQLPWPTRGKLDNLFGKSIAKSELTYNGIRILAPEKRTVVAVYPGKVVFADWLKGFGLLTIISHGYGYMSLYANNYSLLRQVGSQVKMNEPIATVGHSGGQAQNGLYFELRKNGRPLAPLLWLAKH